MIQQSEHGEKRKEIVFATTSVSNFPVLKETLEIGKCLTSSWDPGKNRDGLIYIAIQEYNK